MKTPTANSLTPRTQEKIDGLNLSKSEKGTLKSLMNDPIAYIPHEDFSKKSLMTPIMNEIITVTPGTSMNPQDEQTVFLQMNYARHKICIFRRKLLRQAKWKLDDVKQLLHYYNMQLAARSQIVTCNMGLVLAMAQRVKYPGVEFTDLVSEGSMALLRATEKFDCSMGFKFSTYACRAIFKGFSRAAKQCYTYHSRFPAQYDYAFEKDDRETRQHEEFQADLADEFKVIFKENLADLTDIEKSVVKLRFSIGKETSQEPQTLKNIGETLGLTKERIRQIQNNALDKLRVVAEERLIFS